MNDRCNGNDRWKAATQARLNQLTSTPSTLTQLEKILKTVEFESWIVQNSPLNVDLGWMPQMRVIVWQFNCGFLIMLI